MAYSSTNPVRVAAAFGLTDARQLLLYESTHSHGAIEAVGFFVGCGYGSPTGNAVGLKVGDLLMNVNVSSAGSSAITFHRVISLSTSTGYGSSINASVSVASS